MRASKANLQRIHARRRALQRFGVRVGPRGMAAIVAQIQNGQAKFLEKQSNRCSLWRVTFDGETMIAVYDRKRGTVATFLTPQMYEDRSWFYATEAASM